MQNEEFSPLSYEEQSKKTLGTFGKYITQEWAKINNHTVFSFHTRELPPGKQIHENKVGHGKEEFSTIFMPDDPTFEDLIEAAHHLKPDASETDPLNVFASKLRDTAIYLSHQPQFEGVENNTIIELLFHLGSTLQVKSQDTHADPIHEPCSAIELLEIIPPDGADAQLYEDSLFFFLLGKGTVLGSTDSKVGSDPQNSLYQALYKKYREFEHKEGLDSINRAMKVALNQGELEQLLVAKTDLLSGNPDTRLTQEGFDNYLLLHQKGILSIVQKFMHQSFQPGGRGFNALQEQFDQAVTQQFEEGIAEQGKSYIRKNLEVPPYIEELPPEIQAVIKEQFGDEYSDPKLWETTQQVIADIEKKANEKGIKPTIREKLEALNKLVGAYPYEKTYKPSLVVENRAFECNLRAYILGTMYDEFLGDEVLVLSDSINGHTRLLIAERNGLDLDSIDKTKAYVIDPTADPVIFEEVKDQTLLSHLIQAYKTNPNSIEFTEMVGSEKDHNFREKNAFVSYNKSIRALIWGNAAAIHEGTDGQVLTNKSLDLLPTSSATWANLSGFTSLDADSALRLTYLQKAIDLDPTNYKAWYNLGFALDDVEAIEKCFRKALEINPNYEAARNMIKQIEEYKARANNH